MTRTTPPSPSPSRRATTRLRRGVAVLATGLVLTAGAGACGGGDDEPTIEPTSTTSGATTSVPTTTGAPASTPTTDGQPPVDQSQGAAVDETTVTVRWADQRRWTATGLVRNRGGAAVTSVVVEVEVMGTDDRLGSASVPLPVPVVAPGEAAPFEIAVDLPRDADISEVRWRVRAEPAADRAVPSLDTAVYWTRPFDGPRPIDVPGYADPPGGPRPYVLYGSVTNGASEPLAQPALVVAWLDGDGRVVGVASGRALAPGSDQVASAIGPGQSLDVVVTVQDAEVGPRLAEARTMLWGVSG